MRASPAIVGVGSTYNEWLMSNTVCGGGSQPFLFAAMDKTGKTINRWFSVSGPTQNARKVRIHAKTQHVPRRPYTDTHTRTHTHTPTHTHTYT